VGEEEKSAGGIDGRISYPTVYSRYKNATNRFFDYMTEICPSEMGEARKFNMNKLSAAAESMTSSGHVMERSVLRDLKLAIRIRTRVSKSVYSGGDAGHKHLLDILTHCWSVLNALPKTAKKENKESSKREEKQKETNHFSALMEEDDEDENENEDEEMFPSTPVPRPSLSGPEPMSLDELMRSDDRQDAIIFLYTLDEIMGAVVKHYGTSVLKNVERYQSIGFPKSAIVEELMEAAVATNMAIQQVQKLEMDLMVQHKHLSTPYRLLATLVLPEITQAMLTIIQEHGTNSGCTRRDISIYLGDYMECCFRNRQDPYNRKDTIVQELCRRWQVDSVGTTQLEKFSQALQQLVSIEIPIGPEKGEVARHLSSPQMAGHSSYSWIQNMPFIGGDRAIHHTIRLLQTFGGVIHDTPDHRGIEAKRGIFGQSPWVPGRSHKISDLDDLVMTDILPKWVLMCRKGVIGVTGLPRENELCPLYVLLRKYVKEPQKPVSWSIAFAVHAMTTAVLEVGPVFNTLVSTSKTVFDNYFEQIEWAKRLAENNPESIGDKSTTSGEIWWSNMMSVTFLENLGLPVFGDRTIWNPLCAGTTLSYLAYFGNMECGCALIDCHAQLRITLHLFHALRVNGIICRGEIPMLDMMFDAFRNSKAVWGGRHLPVRGEFVQRFWICFGNNVAETRKMVNEARDTFQGMSQAQRTSSTSKGNRKLVPVEPAEISKSYRRICNRDFHDVVDKYHTPEQRNRCNGSDQYQLMVRTNDTCDAIDEEQFLLSLNLPNMSVLMEQFVNSLGRILQWEPILVNGAAQTGLDQRQGFVYLFTQYLLGALDFANDPFGYEFLQIPLAQASSVFMSHYFSKLNPENAVWFQATQKSC
jgi:hypothetical protein